MSSTRTVCKSEWSYEMVHVWSNAEDYGKWKESPERAEILEKMPKYIQEECEGMSMEEDFYVGARVWDEL